MSLLAAALDELTFSEVVTIYEAVSVLYQGLKDNVV
jgi:hypothetical protein